MRIEEGVEVEAPIARVWKLIQDPAKLTGLDEGLSVEADSETPDPGVRARYRMLMRVGPVPIGADVEVVEFTPRRELAWTSLTGVDHRMRFRVRDLGPGRTQLVLRFGYSSPGPLGLVADLASYGRVRGTLRRLLAALKAEAERPPRRRRKPAGSASKAARQRS